MEEGVTVEEKVYRRLAEGFRGQGFDYPGDGAPDWPQSALLLLRAAQLPAPPPDGCVHAEGRGAAARLTPREEAEAVAAYGALLQRLGRAHAALQRVERQFRLAREQWLRDVDKALEAYMPTQDLLASRLREYQVEAWEVARRAEEAEVERRAAEEARLDRLHGPRRWAVRRFRCHGEPETWRGVALPEAERVEDCRPIVHRADCRLVMELRRPKVEGTARTDWSAEPRRVPRAGFVLERLAGVLEALAVGGAGAYVSQGKVWVNRSVGRKPARVCATCAPLELVAQVMGREAWEEWCAESSDFPYDMPGR